MTPSFLKSLDNAVAQTHRSMVALATADLDLDNDVAGVARYHLAKPGKMIRGRLALSASGALGLDDQDGMALASVCEFLHNASLIHDDLHDRDMMRRGQPAVWARFGDDLAILAGDYFLSLAYVAVSQMASSLREPTLITMIHQRTRAAIMGQAADLADDALDIADYERLVRNKSGALLSLPLELPLLVAGKDEYLGCAREAADAFALAYQILDDIDDGADDSRVGTNILRILRDRCAALDPLGVAMNRVQGALIEARSRAAALPDGSGDLLAHYVSVFAPASTLRVAA